MAGSGAGCNRLKNNRFKAIQDFEENIRVRDTLFLKEGVAGLEASIQIEQDGDVTFTLPTGAKVNIPGINFTDPLTVEEGGTGLDTLTANKLLVGNGTSDVLLPTELHWDNTNKRLGIGNTSPLYPLVVKGVSSGYGIALQKSDGSANYSGIFEDSSGNHEVYLKSNANNTNVFLNTSGDSYFNGGKLGVGTDIPISIFNISQDSATVSFTMDNTRDFSNSNVTRIASRIKDSSGALQNFGYIDVRSIDASSLSKDTQFLIRGYNNNNFETFMTLESGNVGIGTNPPSTKLDVNGPIKCASYTVGTVPSPISPAGSLIYVTDESGGAIHCFSDGTNWRRVSDRAIIS